MPVNSPLFFTRSTKDDSDQIQQKTKRSTIDINSFCTNVRKKGDFNTDRFHLINDPPCFYNEFHTLNHYLASLPKDIETIIRFQSSLTTMGQLYFAQYPVDGFLACKKKSCQKLIIKIIQYQSVFRHGHHSSCWIKNNEKSTEIGRYNFRNQNENKITTATLWGTFSTTSY